jgi:hypothetical protein
MEIMEELADSKEMARQLKREVETTTDELRHMEVDLVMEKKVSDRLKTEF